jgi:CheY-like chemotaxis protein
MSYVLAIEPNQGQASVLRDVVTTNTVSKVVVVGSVESAMAAMEHGVPSVILVNALMPPNEESDLVERLRSFPRDAAPEILITPVFSESDRKDSLLPGLGRFGRRRIRQPRSAGSARLNFTEQLSTYLSLVEARHASAALIREPEPAPAPEPVSMVAAPERQLSGADRRASVRIERVAWARVRINGTPVKMVDLSATGAQILSPTVLRLGDSVHVMLANDADIVQCDAGIVWGAFDMIGSASTPLFRAGISFKDADRPAIERLCIEQHRTGPGGPFFQSKDY